MDMLCCNSTRKLVQSKFLQVLGECLGTHFLNCYGNPIQISKKFIRCLSPNTWQFLFCEKYKSILHVFRKRKKKKFFYFSYRGNLVVFLTRSSHDLRNFRGEPGTHMSFKTEHTGFSTSENFEFRLCLLCRNKLPAQ